MRKLKLKEDEAGNKITDIRGIRSACKVMKTRFAKPFESVQIKIPYDTGMDPYSGCVDLFEKAGILVKDGNKLRYTPETGDEIKEFRKNWSGEKLQRVINDVGNKDIEAQNIVKMAEVLINKKTIEEEPDNADEG
jgi:hypothetical protein